MLTPVCVVSVLIFKFQSDSINTWIYHWSSDVTTLNALNYNLILLIRFLFWFLRSVFCPLNSNLILLIRGRSGVHLWQIHSFKFQSDSINTPAPSIVDSSISLFKFQSDSINTTRMSLAMYFFSSFKFQSDSINTGLRPERHQQIYRTLNSNLILLIRGGSL